MTRTEGKTATSQTTAVVTFISRVYRTFDRKELKGEKIKTYEYGTIIVRSTRLKDLLDRDVLVTVEPVARKGGEGAKGA